MPGAFAHIAAVARASENSALMRSRMPRQAKLMLSRNAKFIELGSVSPDYPYLNIKSPDQAQWADCMHYDRAGDLIKCFINKVKEMNDEAEKEKSFAWLCGYVGHVIADITIHPVVELRVGSYDRNKDAHRICEMHQDAFIWPKVLNLGNVGYADRVRKNIGGCCDPDDSSNIDGAIERLWRAGLSDVHSQLFSKCDPGVSGWHKGFVSLVVAFDLVKVSIK